jgi:hypothetical protein
MIRAEFRPIRDEKPDGEIIIKEFETFIGMISWWKSKCDEPGKFLRLISVEGNNVYSDQEGSSTL